MSSETQTRSLPPTHPGARPLPPEVRDTLYQELVALSIELDEMPEGNYGRRIDVRERQAQVRRLLMEDAAASSSDEAEDLAADEMLDEFDDEPGHTLHLDEDPLVLRDPEPRVIR